MTLSAVKSSKLLATAGALCAMLSLAPPATAHGGGRHSVSSHGARQSAGAHSGTIASSSHASASTTGHTTAVHSGATTPHDSTAPGSRTYVGVKRDEHGRIARDPHAKEAFRRSHPCPATGKTYGQCPGYVVDHLKALKRGGADDPSNMQWQTRPEAKAKDSWE